MPPRKKRSFLQTALRAALAATIALALGRNAPDAQEAATPPETPPGNYAAKPLEDKYILWEQRSLGLGDPNEPLCADFNLDGTLELFLSDKSGRLVLLDARTGKRIWARTIPGTPLLDPLPGQFIRPFPPEIALLREDGHLLIIAAATGETLVDARVSASAGAKPPRFHLSPSIVPAGALAPLDALFAVSDERILFRFDPAPPDQVTNAWAGRPIASLMDMPQHPPAIGRFMHPERQDAPQFAAVFASLGRQLFFLDLMHPDLPPVCRPVWGYEGERALTALSESLDGFVQEILLCDPLGNVRAFTLDFSKTPPAIEPTADAAIATACVPYREYIPLIADLDHDGHPDLILTAASRIAAVNRQPGGWTIKTHTIARRFITPPALFFSRQNPDHPPRPVIVIAEDSGALLFLDMSPGVPQEHSLLQRVEMGPLPPCSILVLDADQNRRANILIHKRGAVAMLSTTFPIHEAVPWPSAGGSKLHTGGRSFFFEQFLARRHASQIAILENTIASARHALEEGRYEDALAECRQALSFNPAHVQAREIQNKALLAQNRNRLLTGAVLLLLAISLALWMLKRFLNTRRILRSTREMADNDRQDEILPAFQKYFRFRSGPLSVIAHLAEICVEHDLLPVALAQILQKGHRLLPQDDHIALTLARVYLEADKLDAEAAPVYEKASRLAPETGLFALALGRIHLAAGNTEDARLLLEDAYRQGCRDGRLYDALAEVYIRLDQLIPRYLRVFETAARRNPGHVPILEALAKSYVNAGLQQDSKAQDVFQRLLRLDPQSVVANQETAAAFYRAGQYAEAKQAARKALSQDLENRTALQVLGWCLWEEKDLSPETRHIYLQASERNPQDTQLLRVVAQILLENAKCEDFPPFLAQLRAAPDAPISPAPERILRAIEANPTDTAFLALAAEAGIRWGHRPILRRSLELLSESKEITDAQIKTLAEVYVSEGENSPRRLDIFSRAFEMAPDTEGLAEHLAAMLIEVKNYDPRYLDVFQRLFARQDAAQPSSSRRMEWGIHLAKMQNAAEQYSAMAETLQTVLAELETPTDTGSPAKQDLAERKAEVRHLLAVAHSNLRNFTQAVDHYRSLLEANPDDQNALIGLGHAYARMDKTTGHMHEAILRARELAPEDPVLNFSSGNIAVERADWNNAAAFFLKALKSGDEHQDAVLHRLAFLARHYQGARAIPVRWLFIQMLLVLKRYEEAHEEIEAVYTLDPAQAGRAIAAYDRILQTDSHNVIALYGKARILHRDGRHTEARQLLETALLLRKDHEPTRRLMVEVYDALLAKQGENLSLRFALGQLCVHLADYDRAVPCFQKTRRDPNLAQVSTRYLAECFFHKKMHELALQEFQNIPLDPPALPILYALAIELENQGNLLAARMAYQRIYAHDAAYKDVADRLNSLTQSSDAALRTLHQAAAAGLGPRPLTPQDKNALLENLAAPARQRYDLREELGRGAMAAVYRAHDTELDEDVALKILPDTFLNNPEALRRFRLEARSARKLSHENIVRIHDIGEEQGRKYISMEFIHGQTLKQIIKTPDFPLQLRTQLRFARQIAIGMSYAHSADIIHRDLKPANIMIAFDETGSLEKGKVKITDFGIAKIGDHASHTITGAVVGTPLYMSPEQVLGKPCDPRADIYSFGVVLYELLTGKPPFSEGDLAYHHLHTEPPPLPSSVLPAMEHIVMKCLKKVREDRWNNFDEILEALDKIEIPSGETI